MENYVLEEKSDGFYVKEASIKYDIPLQQRIFNFVVRAIKYLKTLQKSNISNVIIYQLTKAATSEGANYEEAQGASSKNDFISKTAIAHREAKEANYWLRVIKGSDIDDSEELDYLICESAELRNILGSIVGKARKNK